MPAQLRECLEAARLLYGEQNEESISPLFFPPYLSLYFVARFLPTMPLDLDPNLGLDLMHPFDNLSILRTILFELCLLPSLPATPDLTPETRLASLRLVGKNNARAFLGISPTICFEMLFSIRGTAPKQKKKKKRKKEKKKNE